MPKCSEIHVRDPFIVPVAKDRCYWLFGTTDADCWGREGTHGFDCYRSTDLENWEGPFSAFRPAAEFWATHNFWAPEVHFLDGRWYMLASFKAHGACRGTQVLVADRVEGPYRPHSNGPVTPRDWECLDGTLFVDPAGDPWMVFCHEWVQIRFGTINAVKLAKDLSKPAGPAITLIDSRDAKWIPDRTHRKDIVTDGPFLHRMRDGQLLLLWSSFLSSGYAIAAARSASGSLQGPWQHDLPPIYQADGGHGMLFRTFTNRLMLSIHSPNKTPDERPVFIELCELEGTLQPVPARHSHVDVGVVQRAV